jgi:hypothetical protein
VEAWCIAVMICREMFKVAVEETNVWICTKHRPSPLEKDKRMGPKMILYRGKEEFHCKTRFKKMITIFDE